MSADTANFWNPSFDFDYRDDGSILMWQSESLNDYMPTIADYLDQWAERTPDNIWLAKRKLEGGWQELRYGEARAMVRAIADSLLSLGLGPDKPLIVLSENSIEHALLGMACAYVGIPYSPVSPAYSLLSEDHAKLKHVVGLLKPGAVFADNASLFERALHAVEDFNHDVITVTDGINNTITYQSLLQGDPQSDAVVSQRVGLTEDTVVKYLFTSGSTGSPKAVINTNGMICSMQEMVRDCYRFLNSEPPIVLDWAPWNHTAAGNKVFYLVLTNGGSYYLDEGKPVPAKIGETVRNLKEIACTWYFNVPAGWDMLVEQLEQDAELAEVFFSQLRMMFYAGAGMAQHTWDRLRAAGRNVTGHEVLLASGLGATETAPFALACTDVQEKSGNIGVPSRGLTMKLVPTGGKLELRLKGPSITPGYYGNAEKTAEAFDSEGYYKMGDALRAVDSNDLSQGFFFDGRIAENFKLTTGTFVAVGAVRSALVDAMNGLIRDAVITGENMSKVGALLVLSEKAKALSPENLTREIDLHLCKAASVSKGSASRVVIASVLEDSPSFDKGEITEKGSLNQRALRENKIDQINEMYTGKGRLFRVPV